MIPNLIIFLVLYVFISALIYFFHAHFIFYPPEKNILRYQSLSNNSIQISGLHKLQAWLFTNKQVNNKHCIIYFGGNAEDVAFSTDLSEKYNAKYFICVNLSGYGESKGKPSEKSFFRDGTAVYDYVISNLEIASSEIIVLGRSLGASTAIYISLKRKPAKLIVITPFESIWAMIPAVFKLFIPLPILLRNKFNNLKNIVNISCPVLMLAASNDEVIPVKQIKRLNLAVSDNSEFIVINEADHQSILNNDETSAHINEFLSK